MQLAHSDPYPSFQRFDNRGISIDAAVIIKDNQLLLIKRGNEPCLGMWPLPGSYVDWNKTVEQAFAREVFKDTNLTVKKLELATVMSQPGRHPKRVISVIYAGNFGHIQSR